MKTSGRWKFGSIGSKIMVGLVLAAMFGSLDAAPAFARDDRDRGERHDNDRGEHRGRGYDRGRNYGHDRREYRTTVYRERVYVPPPVYYAPPPPPGISIFFPSITIRP